MIKSNKTRPHSISVEDAFFGDSGKGSVTTKLLYKYKKVKEIINLRYNGGANAGHETYVNGKKIVTHQLPSGIVLDNAVAIITRGTVLHPQDLLTEIKRVAKTCGKLPGKLIIDDRTPLALDTHRAREVVMNKFSSGGKGSTGKGISSAYESVYGRYAVTLRDLLSKDWLEILGLHYEMYDRFISGFGINLKDVSIVRLDPEKKTDLVGTKKEFLQSLGETRKNLKNVATDDVFTYLRMVWKNEKIPFVIEGAQGAGIDPYHGVYPDITASRPMSRNINDGTYNVILPEEISVRVGVMKTTYLSSVGIRKLPAVADSDYEKWIQKAFDEKGRTTGRLRDIYPVSIPIAKYLRRGAGYTHLVPTHLDASRSEQDIEVVTHYTDKKTGKETPYLPYQDALDNMKSHSIKFSGWDGEKVKKAKTFAELPSNCKKLLKYFEKNIAPIYMATYGADLEEFVMRG